MTPNTPSSPAPPPTTNGAPTPAPKKSRWLLYGCGTMVALLLVIVATVAITFWWIQRPIKPVVLSAAEKATVEEKMRHLGGTNAASASKPKAATPAADPAAPTQPDRTYTPGSKVLRLTEREINGLLNLNTELGKTVRLEFDKDAINAYVAVPIPQDFPIGGGKMFRARGQFRVSLGHSGGPYAILEDVTVFGVSLPKAWLGGLKGENLLGEAMGDRQGSGIKGIKSVCVEPGALVIEVED